jgi:hypothetical protein
VPEGENKNENKNEIVLDCHCGIHIISGIQINTRPGREQCREKKDRR